jgi:phenylacetate-CoA oxygenase PaaH subunit
MQNKNGPCGKCSCAARRAWTTSIAAACTRPIPKMAIQMARDVYTRRQEGTSVWVVRSDHIVASDPGDKDMYFDPAEDKVYRHPTFYKLPGRSTTCERTPCKHPSPSTTRPCSTCCASATPPGPGQRLAEWTGHAPVLEEDIALANMALDLVGQARAVLTHAGKLEGAGPRRGPAGLPARRARLPQRHAGRTAARRLRRHRAAQRDDGHLLQAAVGALRTRATPSWPPSPARR